MIGNMNSSALLQPNLKTCELTVKIPSVKTITIFKSFSKTRQEILLE